IGSSKRRAFTGERPARRLHERTSSSLLYDYPAATMHDTDFPFGDRLKIASMNYQTKRADPVPYFGQTVFDNELSCQPQDRFGGRPGHYFEPAASFKVPGCTHRAMRDNRKSDNLHENSSYRSVSGKPVCCSLCNACFAASCSDCFLVFPLPLPKTLPPTAISVTKHLSWSGPLSETTR